MVGGTYQAITCAISAPKLIFGERSENRVFMLAPRKIKDSPIVQARRVLQGKEGSSYGWTAARTSG
jgi:hypothetical protein